MDSLKLIEEIVTVQLAPLFIPMVKHYWADTIDASLVEAGQCGALLLLITLFFSDLWRDFLFFPAQPKIS